MRSALITNTSLAAGAVSPNPMAQSATSGQAASSFQLNTEKISERAVISKERGASVPKKTDGIFAAEPVDPDKEGAVPESTSEGEFSKTKKLLGVA